MTFAVRSSWSTGSSGPTPAGLVLGYNVVSSSIAPYAWNASNGFTSSPTVSFSGTNDVLTWSPTSAGTSVYVASGTAINTGKVYCEFSCTVNTGNMPIGFGVQSASIDQFYQPNGASIFAGAGGCGLGTQGLYLGATLVSSGSGYSFTTGDRIGIAFDTTTKNVWFSKNGSWISGDPATNTSPSTTLTNPDTFASSVTLLLHMNGVNGSTTFTDTSSYATVLTASNAQISTAQSQFGGGSGAFSFASSSQLTAPTSNQFRFAGDFTVECWIRPTTLTITATFYGKVIFDTRASGGSSGGGVLYVKFGVLNFYTGGVNIAGSIAFVADDWIHVAVTRSGSDIKIWQGGVQTGTTLTNSSNLSDGLFAISVETIANQSWFDGYIDEFRITNGVARYTTTFTPPTVQFTNPSFGTPPFYFTAGQYSCATTGGTHSQQIFPRASSQSSTAPSGFTAYAPPDYSVSISLNENPAVPITSPLNAIVDWGDGSFVTYTVAGTYTHTYAAASPYTVSISGTCAAVDTLADPAFLGVNSWNAYLGLQTLNAAAYSTNSVYVPSNLPYTLQRVRISGTFNSSTVVSWDTSNLTDMSSMFAGAIGFNQDISGWNTGAVTTMASMFAGRTTFNQPLNSWDTALVTNMSSMFSGASAFNQPLANWNTHLVTNMNSMFSNASVFNQDISLWCVYLIPSLPSGFNTGGTLTGGYFPVWGTCPIVNPFPIVLTGPTYGVFTGNPATTFPITLTGPTYGVFTGNPTTTLPITLSR